MSELLNFEQLDVGLELPEAEINSIHQHSDDDQHSVKQGYWYDIQARGASFLAKLPDPFWAEFEVGMHLAEAVNHLNKEFTWGKLYGIEVEEVMADYSIEIVSAKRQQYYDTTIQADKAVLLMEVSTDILPKTDTIC